MKSTKEEKTSIYCINGNAAKLLPTKEMDGIDIQWVDSLCGHLSHH